MDQSIEKLQVATALVAFEDTLRSSANTVAYFAAIPTVLGIVVWITVGFASSLSALAIGGVLFAESLYIRKSRSARALLISGITFAVFAVWLLGRLAVGIANHDSSQGRGAIGGALLAIGAWNILRSYAIYKTLLADSDPSACQYVRDAIEQLRIAKPGDNPQIVEFKNRGMGEKGTLRLQPDGELLLICKFADKTFGIGGKPEQAAYVRRQDVQIQNDGDRWLGKDVNATLLIMGGENKIHLKPEMLTRLEALLTGTPSSAM